jgi:hypothetical protein
MSTKCQNLYWLKLRLHSQNKSMTPRITREVTDFISYLILISRILYKSPVVG